MAVVAARSVDQNSYVPTQALPLQMRHQRELEFPLGLSPQQRGAPWNLLVESAFRAPTQACVVLA